MGYSKKACVGRTLSHCELEIIFVFREFVTEIASEVTPGDLLLCNKEGDKKEKLL